MTNKLKPVKDGGSIVSIVLEIQKREDNEIPVHSIHEIKAKDYDVNGINVCHSKLNQIHKKRIIRCALYY